MMLRSRLGARPESPGLEVSALLRSRLLEAVQKNDVESLKKVLTSVPNPADENPSDLSQALIEAASKGFHDIVDVLLQFGADQDQPDCYSNTPLILSAERGHTLVVEKLLQANCQVNGTDMETRTALHWASMNGHTSIVDMLLQNGAIPDQKDKIYRFTPLMLAARQGHASVLQLLLQHPCDVNKTDIHGETPLFDAVRNNQLDCVRLLIDADANINHIDNNGRTPLLAAVLWKRTEVAIILIRANCDLEIAGVIQYVGPTDTKRCTPLEAALLDRKFTLAQILVAAGSNCNMAMRYAFFADMMACLGMSPAMAQWVKEVVRNPRTLREQCRMQIRRDMGTELSKKLNQLPLPASLKTFLTIPELDNFLQKSPSLKVCTDNSPS